MSLALKFLAGWLVVAAAVSLVLARILSACSRRDEEAQPETVADRARGAGL